MKPCILILPYFGQLKNYFSLFLKSIEKNKGFTDLLLITDNIIEEIPSNVIIKQMSFLDFKKYVKEKLKMDISLETPYKLCDYKPSYGFLFQDIIYNYKYWGYCDCDLIFGDMKHFLLPLFKENYDKIFATGHLTLFLNTSENNKVFMEEHNGFFPYQEAFSKNVIYVFDEDCKQKNNIHDMYLEKNKKVYSNDLSANISTSHNHLFIVSYFPESRLFLLKDHIKRQFYYNNGSIVSCWKENGYINYEEYLYIHLQLRKMRVKGKKREYDTYQICPDRFIFGKKVPKKLILLKKQRAHLRFRPIDVINSKIKGKLEKWFH